jgi:hypothetical protein
MSNVVQTIVITTSSIKFYKEKFNLEQINNIVGGSIRILSGSLVPDIVLYANANAIMQQLPMNQLVYPIIEMMHSLQDDKPFGTIIITAEDGKKLPFKKIRDLFTKYDIFDDSDDSEFGEDGEYYSKWYDAEKEYRDVSALNKFFD